MGRIPVDFSKVQSFDVLPEGLYEGTIESITYREPRSEGKFAQLSVALVVTGGEFDNRKAWQNLSMSEKAAFRMKRFFDLFALGDDMDGLDIDEEADPPILVDPDLVGEPVMFRVKHRKYDGETTADVTVTEWLGGSAAPAAVEEDEAPEETPAPAPRKPATASKAPAAAPTRPVRRALR